MSKSPHPPLTIKGPNTLQLPTPPPTRDDDLPSPRVSAVLHAFRLRRAGRPSKSLAQPWRKFSLSPAEYCQLQIAVQHDVSLRGYIEDKLRYDYFPHTQQLVIRMPTRLHELLIAYVVKEINDQLNRISAWQSSSADFARHIVHDATSDIKPLDPDYGPHSPDASFRHDSSSSPGVVLEVSYSQKRKDLPRLADEYILGSNGNIQVMIGLDLEYKGSEAVLCVWKPVTKVEPDGSLYLEVEQVVHEIFRGQVLDNSAGLRIPLEDFAQSNVRVQYQQPITGEIHISTSQLSAFLAKAEQQHYMIRDKTGLAPLPLVPGMKKRRRDVNTS